MNDWVSARGAAGLAGEPLGTSSATLYDASRVRGLLEIRVPPGSTSESWTRIGNAGAIVRVQLRVLAERYDFLPTVATCCGLSWADSRSRARSR